MRNLLLISSVATLALAGCQKVEKPADQTSAATGAAAPAALAAADSGKEEAAIRGQVDRWLQLVKAKDAASIAQLYTEDGAVMPPNAAIGQGREAIQKTWASLLAIPGFDLSFTPQVIAVSSSGDMALDRGTYNLTVAPDGKTHKDSGKYVVVWRKVGGEWKAAADIFNSDLPASGG